MAQGFTREDQVNIYFTTASNADTASYLLYTGIPNGTASYALKALSASYAPGSPSISASYAVSASYANTSSWAFNVVTASYALQALSSSYALSASYALTSSYSITASYALTCSLAISAARATFADTSSITLAVVGDSGRICKFTSSISNANLVLNPGFENVNETSASNVNTFPNWTGSRIVSASFSAHSGVYACRLIDGGSFQQSHVTQDITITPGNKYILSFWTKNNGNISLYGVRDLSNNVDIVPGGTYTGISSTGYVYFTKSFDTSLSTSLVRITLGIDSYLFGGPEGYYDDVSLVLSSSLLPTYTVVDSLLYEGDSSQGSYPLIFNVPYSSGSIYPIYDGTEDLGRVDRNFDIIFGKFFTGTSYLAVNATTSSYTINALSSSYTLTSSYAGNTTSASYTLTSSFASNVPSSSTALSASHALIADISNNVSGSEYHIAKFINATYASTNMINDGGFENGGGVFESSWSIGSILPGSVAITTEKSHTGLYSVKMVDGGVLNPSNMNYGYVYLQPNTTYIVSFWYYLSAGYINFSSLPFFVVNITSSTNRWTEYTTYINVTSSFTASFQWLTSLGCTFFIDDVSVFSDISSGGGLSHYVGNSIITEISNSIGIGISDVPSYKLQVSGTVAPDIDSAFDLGSPTHRWRTIYATLVSGSISGSVTNADTASYISTASYALQSLSASYAPSAPSLSSSYALSASWAPSYGRTVVLCTAFTPVSIGPDAAEIPMPYSPVDGVTPISWSVKRINIRTQLTESVTSSITIEKSLGSGVFSAVPLGAVSLLYPNYEASNTSPGTTINSGDKMRFYVNVLGGAINWTVTTELNNI